MSFRGRLTLFFVLIVVLPTIVLAFVVREVADESEESPADARLEAGLATGVAVYQRHMRETRAAAAQIGRDRLIGGALETGDRALARSRVKLLVRRHSLRSLAIRKPAGKPVASTGTGLASVAVVELELRDRAGDPVALLEAAAVEPRRYLDEVSRLTGRDAALALAGGAALATLQTAGLELPGHGGTATVEVAGDELRAAAVDLPAEGPRLTLFTTLGPGGFLPSTLVAIALIAFFALAIGLAILLLRSLESQVGTMLVAAQRIGEGDFSQRVPVVGRDQMAGLARELNKMSQRLETQMGQLRRQRTEIDRSVRRIGAAFASGLDREAQLKIIVETALAACEGQYGLIALSGRRSVETERGTAQAEMRYAAVAAEGRAAREGRLVESSRGEVQAIAAPIHRVGAPGRPVGAMSVARARREFTQGEREVFLYLIGQAASAVENLALHELVAEQAVTDELTGLSNQRAFRQAAAREAERAERFGHPLSMLFLDLDDFKRINDTHGHMQGDQVLRRVGQVLQAESRAVDEPARYGGEEFAMVLPETDADGAFELAERIRMRIAGERVELIEDQGQVGVTVSIGVATMPGAADDVDGLIAASDAALYQAKRAGKNRVRRARGRPRGMRG